MSEADSAQIESQLSPEQLQLFAEENDTMLRHYEDTLGKVQYVSLYVHIVDIKLTIFRIGMQKNHFWRYLHYKKPWCLTSPLKKSIYRSWSAMLK